MHLRCVPNGTSSAAPPPSSPSLSCGWSVCPHLGALISHISTHRIHPARSVIFRRFVICKPAQQLRCAVSHRPWAAPTSVFSAADKPTFHPSPGPRAHASTHPPFHVVCALACWLCELLVLCLLSSGHQRPVPCQIQVK